MRNGALPRTLKIISIVLLILVAVAFFNIQGVSAQTPIVHAVLFYSPSCGHCYKVITEDLPPLLEKYGDQLIILPISVQDEGGGELFLSAIRNFDIPLDHAGVPFLVVGEVGLMGSVDIPEKFPAIVEAGLASGGIDWPQIPGLIEYMQEAGLIEAEGEQPAGTATSDILPTQTEPSGETGSEGGSQPQDTSSDSSSLEDVDFKPITMKQRFLQDVVGNSISVLVLVGMLFVVGWVVLIVIGRWEGKKACPIGVIVGLVIIGLVVSVYMSFIELAHETAVCGPVGDCNTVQQSEYATLFGIIPIGVLGIVGYCLVAVVWFVRRWGPEKLQWPAANILFAMTFGGTLFSIYLTYLEPFVIGATCAWCLTSAIVMTALMWCSAQESISFGVD
jgi:uncharacterized membrane protein